MNWLLKASLVVVLITITAFISYEYTYSLPYHLTANFQDVILDTGGTNTADVKTKLLEISDVYQLSIMYKHRQISGRDQYIFYTSETPIPKSTINKFNEIEYQSFENLESSNLYDSEIFIEDTSQTDEAIAELQSIGVQTTVINQVPQLYTITKQTFAIVGAVLLINCAMVLIYHSSKLKEYTIYLLEGYSKWYIVKNFLINQFRFISLLAIVIVLVFLVTFGYSNFYLYKWLLASTISYELILALFNIIIINLSLKNSYSQFMRNQSRNTQVMRLMLVLKVVAVILIILYLPKLTSLFLERDYYENQISKYQKFDDLVVSQTYSPYTGMESDFDPDKYNNIISDYYMNTVEKYHGFLYGMTTGVEGTKGTINYNTLNALKIKDVEGNVITSDDLSLTTPTTLVSASNKTEISKLYPIVQIADNQKFISSDLYQLGRGEYVFPTKIDYYPQNLSPSQVRDSNIGSAVSKSQYFLEVPGTNKFEQLIPMIKKSNATGYIVSAPSITVYLTESLQNILEQIYYTLYLLIIVIGASVLLTAFVISTYIKINGKKIVVQRLEGQNKLITFSGLYGVISLELIICSLLIISGKTTFITVIIVLCSEYLLVTLLIEYIIKNKYSQLMKGKL